MSVNRVLADEPFSVSVFGFAIDQPPPPMTTFEVFPASPTSPVALATSTTNAVPPQTIVLDSNHAVAAFDDPLTPGLVQLSLQSLDGAGFDSGHIDVGNGGEVKLTLTLDAPVNVTFGVELAAVTYGAHDTELTIEANGTHVVSRQHDNDQNWHWLTFTIPAALLVAGQNTLKIYATESKYGFWVQAASVSSESVPVTAYYFWQTVAQGSVTPSGINEVQVAVTSGTSNTTTEIETFSETVGGKVGAGAVADLLGGISAGLSFSFTHTSTTQHSITVSQSTTTTTTVGVAKPASPVSVAYQVWQIGLTFAVDGGASITQALSEAQAPLIMREIDADGNSPS